MFGSYARGAPAPNDLDLLVIHEPIPQTLLDQWTAYYFDNFVLPRFQAARKAHYRCLAALGKTIRRPGEKIDIMYETDAARALESLLGRRDAKMLWSDTDRDWESKLNAIVPVENAGTAPRAHIVSVKRITDHRECIEKIVDGIAHKELSLTRFPVESLTARLTPQHKLLLEHWQRSKAVGKDSMKLLPFILVYFQTLRQRATYIDGGGELSISNTTHSTLVQIGKPRLWHAVYYLRRNKKLKRVAFFLHLKRDEPNEVLVFERGENWGKERMDEREEQRDGI